MLNERIERLELLLHRCHVVEAVQLVEVDMVGAEALQAVLGGLEKMVPRRPAAVRSRRYPPEGLGRDHNGLAGDAEILQSAARHLLRSALGIDVRGVDEVHPGIDSSLHERVRAVLLDLSDGLPAALAAIEGHGAEAELGDLEAAVTECAIAHDVVFR